MSVSFWGFLTWVAYAVIFGFFSHYLMAKHPESAITKAAIYITG